MSSVPADYHLPLDLFMDDDLKFLGDLGDVGIDACDLEENATHTPKTNVNDVVDMDVAATLAQMRRDVDQLREVDRLQQVYMDASNKSVMGLQAQIYIQSEHILKLQMSIAHAANEVATALQSMRAAGLLLDIRKEAAQVAGTTSANTLDLFSANF